MTQPKYKTCVDRKRGRVEQLEILGMMFVGSEE
jgi:hypothetical protein